MQPEKPAVLVIHPANDAALANLVPETGLCHKYHPDDRPTGALDALLQAPPAVAATVIDTGVIQPLPMARRIQQAAPHAQLIFVGDEANDAGWRTRFRTLPLTGAHWVALDRGNPRLSDQIRDQIALGEQRLRHRAMLGRVNVQLQTRRAVDPQTLHRLVLSEKHLTSIVKHSPDPIVTLAPGGDVMSWNDSAEQLWGWRASDVLGRNLREFLAPPTREAFARSMDNVVRSREHVRHEFVATAQAGAETPVELTIAPVLDDRDEVIAFSVMARDVSERRRADRIAAEHRAALERAVAERTAELQHTIEQLEQFSYTVSHDLRGPVRAMHGYARILQEEFAGAASAEAAHYTERILRASERMDRLIADVLAYSRVATVPLEQGTVNTQALVQDIIAHLPEESTRGAEITIESALPPVAAHEALLGQALGNLIGNALKFVAPGTPPRVRIWAVPRDSRVRLFVADNGIGIDEPFRRKIFGMFERGPGVNGYEGTGIGLAIVKKSVERLGGTIGFEPHPGGGTVFWIELPAAS